MSTARKPPRRTEATTKPASGDDPTTDPQQRERDLRIADTSSGLPHLVPGCDVANANAYELVALSRLNVLLVGETGTGKSRLAKLLHATAATRGRSAPKATFVNMAAIPESLAESQLFGCKEGAFTHAKESEGILGQCKGRDACVVFDEIGHASPEVQAKLLTALEEGEYHRVGDYGNPRTFRARVLATASNPEMILPELRFRIAQIQIRVPPLRQDPDRIRILASQFFRDAMHDGWKVDTQLDARTLDDLASRPWPGNIRQLLNYTHRLAAFAAPDGSISDSFRRLVDHMDQESSSSNALELAFRNLPINELHIDKVKMRYAAALRARLRGKLGDAKKILGVADDTMRVWIEPPAL